MLSEVKKLKISEHKVEDENTSILEEIIELERSDNVKEERLPTTISSTLVGVCLDAKHPTLQGRVLVEWKTSSRGDYRRWLPTLMSVTVRKGDTVLLSAPENWPEPVVIGVLDGFALRPSEKKVEKASLDLEKDESISVYAVTGDKILEVFYEDTGPVVRLMKEDIEVEMPGKGRISARSVNIEAKTGDVRIKASEDVKIQGEVVKLN